MYLKEMRARLFDMLYTKSFMYREDPPFKLVSGRESFYYFDCKATTLDPEGCTLIGSLMYEMVKGYMPDAIGGLTLGADPITLSVSIESYRNGDRINPMIVRKEPKKHGTQKWIEGNLAGVKRVIAVDDVITTGGSTITAIERMRESGLEVIRAAVIIDREEGGRENIEKLGIEVMSLFPRSEFDRRRLG
jgi:orotate phosphoribosyltransferase